MQRRKAVEVHCLLWGNRGVGARLAQELVHSTNYACASLAPTHLQQTMHPAVALDSLCRLGADVHLTIQTNGE